MSGIEYAFEKEIRGRAAKVVVHTDARRRPVAQTERPSTDGAAVILTLDEPIQHIAERELERAMAETQAHGRQRAGDGAVHGRDPGDGGSAHLQPEPLRLVPELALAQPRGLGRLRARLDLQDRHRGRGDPGERGRAGRAHRLRQRQDRDRGHRDQRPRGVLRSSPSAGRDPLERHRHDPRGAAARARELRALRARLRLRRRDRRRPARRVGGSVPPDRALERALAADAVVRAGDRRHRAADDDGGGGGGQRRLPDEAVRGEAGRGRRGSPAARDQAARGAPRARAGDRRHAHLDPAGGGARGHRAARRRSPATWWRARPAPRRRSTPAAATR